MGGEDASGRGNAGGREDAGPSGNGGAQLASSSSSSSQLASSRPSRDLRTSAANAFVAAYPWIHAGWEGVVFWCWLRYILTSGETHDPALWLLRLCTTRVSPAEASLRRAATESNRASRLDRMSSPRSSWVNRHVGTRLTRAGYFALDYAQGGLMAAVVGFKLLVSWFLSFVFPYGQFD
jgi:peroxin-12